jgi:hypothetical protein
VTRLPVRKTAVSAVNASRGRTAYSGSQARRLRSPPCGGVAGPEDGRLSRQRKLWENRLLWVAGETPAVPSL